MESLEGIVEPASAKGGGKERWTWSTNLHLPRCQDTDDAEEEVDGGAEESGGRKGSPGRALITESCRGSGEEWETLAKSGRITSLWMQSSFAVLR